MKNHSDKLICLLVVVVVGLAAQCDIANGTLYSSKRDDSEVRHNRVAGGYPAKEGEFPSFVTLKISTRYSTVICSGVLITDDIVLTAAHCLDSWNIKKVKVSLGISGFSYWDKRRIANAKKWCKSPNFQTDVWGMKSDFAIVVLEDQIKVSSTVQPATLPDAPISSSTKAFAVGAGRIDERNTFPRVAQVLPVKNVQCDTSDRDPTRICFRSSQDKYKGDTCQGDSGGPIYGLLNGKQYVYGLTSFGDTECRKGRVGVSINADVYRMKSAILKLAASC